MPLPTGSYDIGTRVYQVNDTSRTEIYGDADTFRKFNFQIWFPFEKTNEKDRAPWLIDQEVTSQALSKDFGFPGFLLNQTKYVISHSYLNADFTEEKTYPIVILSHGWGGTKYLHSDLGEMFASEGFIAVSIEHTYGSVASVIDNEVIFKQNNALTCAWQRCNAISCRCWTNFIVACQQKTCGRAPPGTLPGILYELEITFIAQRGEEVKNKKGDPNVS